MVDKYKVDFGANGYMLLESEFGDLVKLKDYEQLEAENKRLKEAMKVFVDRCDKGEVRSTRTYNKFKQLLGIYDA